MQKGQHIKVELRHTKSLGKGGWYELRHAHKITLYAEIFQRHQKRSGMAVLLVFHLELSK